MNKNFKDVGDRFSKYLIYKNLGINKTAEIVGYSGSQISNIKTGKVFGVDKLFNILNNFTDLNPDWLLTGEGNMLKEEFSFSKNDSLTEKDNYIIELQKEQIAFLKTQNKFLGDEINALKSRIAKYEKDERGHIETLMDKHQKK